MLHRIVMNAGTLLTGVLTDVTAADFDRAFAVNTRAPLLLVQAALPLLERGSRVITVSAAITRQANPDLLVQSASKAAIFQSASKAAMQDLSRNLAVELGGRGINVVDVSPGVVRTDLAGRRA